MSIAKATIATIFLGRPNAGRPLNQNEQRDFSVSGFRHIILECIMR